MFLGELYKGQVSGAEFLCAKERGLLAYEQGTGKTIISLAAAEKLKSMGLIKNCLVVTLSSITWQWQDKVTEFTDSSVSTVSARDTDSRSYGQETFYTITSYPLFRRDFETISKKNWDLIICDEAQEFKNNKSKTAKLIKQLNTKNKGKYRWALTGTAISNHLEEIYSIMYWVDKNFLPAWPVFEKRHIVRNPRTNQIVRYQGLSELSPYLKRRMQRKNQTDIPGMPELLPPRLFYTDKSDELKKAEIDLLGHLNRFAEDLELDNNGAPKGVPHDSDVSRAFHNVRQNLVTDAKLLDADRYIKSVLEENDHNRVVIFSFFKEPLRRLAETLGSTESFLFTGEQNSEEKRRAVENFRSTSSVLLCSNAGSTGLDLPFANHLGHLDVPFSWGILDQRTKRITRASSKWSAVTVNFFVVKNSLEEYYYENTLRKGMLAEATYRGHIDELTVKSQSLRSFYSTKAGL